MTKRQLSAAGLVWLVAVSCHAATITDPIPYLSISDTPDGFFDHPGVYCFQDFENPDGPWEAGFTIDAGMRIGPKFISGAGIPVTDSVDADDNAIDGDGTMGSSWFSRTVSLSITFDDPTWIASFVLTDGDLRATKVTVSAYDSDNNLLVSRDYDADFLDDVYTGTTQEDRFFGVNGGDTPVKRISVAIDAGNGLEIDHIQFLKPIPEPASIALLTLGLFALCGMRSRQR